ncbi:MAG: NUDIX hydrolase [Atopobiaceae bacterium]|nr:NUDIX hydrolase [Atopobiaceae bacterium]
MDQVEKLVCELEEYRPYNEQEMRDRALVLARLRAARRAGEDALEDLFGRADPAHMTASAWVVSPDRSKVLMAYHNVYQSWAWLGGHADGECDLRAVALREVREESGLAGARIVGPDMLSVEVLCVDGHEKRGEYVSSHLHLNVTYLVEADPDEPVRVKPDENSSIGWLRPAEALAASTEPWFVERIYAKLVAKTAAMR